MGEQGGGSGGGDGIDEINRMIMTIKTIMMVAVVKGWWVRLWMSVVKAVTVVVSAWEIKCTRKPSITITTHNMPRATTPNRGSVR